MIEVREMKQGKLRKIWRRLRGKGTGRSERLRSSSK